MKNWKCPSCYKTTKTDNNVQEVTCHCCVVKMEEVKYLSRKMFAGSMLLLLGFIILLTMLINLKNGYVKQTFFIVAAYSLICPHLIGIHCITSKNLTEGQRDFIGIMSSSGAMIAGGLLVDGSI